MTHSFQLISDIHLEFYKLSNIPFIIPTADYLILAGDIGKPKSDIYYTFMQDCSEKFKHTFVICGNHEYYSNHHTIQQIDDHFIHLNNEWSNVHFLQRMSFELDDIIILGCTLWSHIPDSMLSSIVDMMNDYNHIMIGKNENHKYIKLDPNYVNQLHQNDLEWLRRNIESLSTDKKILIITHHAPLMKMAGKYYDQILNCAYTTDLSDFIISHSNVKMWCCGHTHQHVDLQIENTRVLSNCKGYPGEKSCNYVEGLSFEL